MSWSLRTRGVRVDGARHGSTAATPGQPRTQREPRWQGRVWMCAGMLARPRLPHPAAISAPMDTDRISPAATRSSRNEQARVVAAIRGRDASMSRHEGDRRQRAQIVRMRGEPCGSTAVVLAFGMTSPTSSWMIAPPPQIAADTTQQPMALVMCTCHRRTTVPSQNQKTVRRTRRAITDRLQRLIGLECGDEAAERKQGHADQEQERQLHGHSATQTTSSAQARRSWRKRSEKVTWPAALKVTRPSSRTPP